MFSFDDLTQLDGYKNAPEEEQQQIKAAYASDFWKDFTSTKEFSSLPSDEREKYATLFDQRFGDVDGKKIRSEVDGRDILDPGYDVVGGLKDLGKTILDVPERIAGATGNYVAGGRSNEDFAAHRAGEDHSWTDSIRENNTNLDSQRQQEFQAEQGYSPKSKVFPPIPGLLPDGITRKDVQELGGNAGFSGANILPSSVAGKVGQVAGGIIGGAGAELLGPEAVPAGRAIGSKIGEFGGQLAMGYIGGERMDKAMITDQLIDTYEQKQLGRKATKGEIVDLLDKTEELRNDHAFWEAMPESVGTVAGLAMVKDVFNATLGKKFGLAFASKLLGEHAVEVGGETWTQQHQTNDEIDLGLQQGEKRGNTWEDWKKSHSEVAPATILLGGLHAGAGFVGGKVAGAFASKDNEAPPPAPSDILKTDSIDTAIDTFNQAVTGSMGNIDAKLSGMEQELNQQYAPEQAPAPGGSLGSKVPVASSADLNDIGRQSQDSPGGGTGDITNAHSPDPFTDYSTDSLMNDFAEQGQDVQGQSDTRGRKIQFDQMMEPVNNQVSLAENSIGRPSTAEEAARAFEQNPPTPKMQQVDDREGIADAFRSVQPWMTDEEIKQRGVELLHDSMPKNGEGSARAGRSTAQEDLSTPYEGKLIDEKFQDNKTVSANPGWTDSVNSYYDDMGLTKDSKDRISIGYDDARATMKAVKAGKTLTANQKNVYAFMEYAGSKLPELAREVAFNRLENKGYDFNKNPETIAAGRLAEGDKVVTTDKFGNPVEFTHKGMDEKGNAILQDHTTIHADPFEPINIIDSKIADKPPIQETKAPIAIGQQNDNQKGGDFNGNKTQEEGQGRGRLLNQQPTENTGADTVTPVVEKTGQSIPEGSFTGKNNKPFKSEKSLLTTARLKKVDLSNHEVIAHEGGFIAIPNAKDNVASNGNEQSTTQNVDPNPSNQAGVQSSGHEIVEHVTRKGKTLRGVVANDLNFKQAHNIFPSTLKKDGGYFIREDHLDKLDAYRADNAQNNAASIQPEQSTVSKTIVDQVKTEPPMNPETDHTLEKPSGLITAGQGSSQSNPETITETTQKSEPSTEAKAKHDNVSRPDSTDTGNLDNAGRDESTSQSSTQSGSNDDTADGQSVQGSWDKQADVSVEDPAADTTKLRQKPVSEMTTADKDKEDVHTDEQLSKTMIEVGVDGTNDKIMVSAKDLLEPIDNDMELYKNLLDCVGA